jgi:hypothetical protein
MLDVVSTVSTVGFPSVLCIMYTIYLDPLIFVFVVFSMFTRYTGVSLILFWPKRVWFMTNKSVLKVIGSCYTLAYKQHGMKNIQFNLH